jgi:hypothetical protein
MAALSACATFGCGSDGPTEPESVSLSDLFGNQLFKADGSSVGLAGLEGAAIIGIYFASTGCPACAAFNPILVDAYNQWNAQGKSFEVVLVTAGESLAELLDYMAESNMPWRAVSPQSNKANYLAQRYNIRWVPTLVIIDAALKTISLTGREELTQTGPAIYDVWLAAGG